MNGTVMSSEPNTRSAVTSPSTGFVAQTCRNVAGALILCLPAIINGYPLIFSDLLDYLGDGQQIVRRLWPGGSHPPMYGVAIEPLHLERSLWPVIFVQGLLIAHLISTVLRVTKVDLTWPKFLLFIGLLCALTSLPWYVSTVMPDIFGGMLILSFFLLAFCYAELSRWERVYFFLLASGSLVVHVSFVPVGLALFVVALGLRLVTRLTTLRSKPLVLAASLVLSLGLTSFVSWKFWGNFAGPPYAPPYLLAHVLVDGEGKRFLETECPTAKFALCGHLDLIPHDVEDFMFRTYSPYRALGKSKQIRAEGSKIVLGSALMFPRETIGAAIKEAGLQVATFSTEVAQLSDLPDGRGGSLADAFAESYPYVAAGYEGTLQSQGKLDADHLRPINLIDEIVVIISVVAMVPLTAKALARKNPLMVALMAVVVIAVIVNGCVTGVAVGVFGRFGARVIWLLPFAAMVSFLALYGRRDRVGGLSRP